jgi:predicted DsbA family dithiol-disulfide isomerase
MSDISIDVVSDVVCPWCFIGKRHLDKAIAQWRAEHPASEVTVSWHPFFLNPDTPEGGEPYRPFLEKKFGGPQGLAEIWQRVREAGKPPGSSSPSRRSSCAPTRWPRTG